MRSPGEFSSGHIPGAFNVPHKHIDTVLDKIKENSQGKNIVVYCEKGIRSSKAIHTLQENGFIENVYRLDGDMASWRSNKRIMQN